MRYVAVCLIAAALTVAAMEVANYCVDLAAQTGGTPAWTEGDAAFIAVLAVAAMCGAGLLQVRAILREMRKERTR